ncbi:hypothetical protein ACJX0J_032984, partial [Zea mays]
HANGKKNTNKPKMIADMVRKIIHVDKTVGEYSRTHTQHVLVLTSQKEKPQKNIDNFFDKINPSKHYTHNKYSFCLYILNIPIYLIVQLHISLWGLHLVMYTTHFLSWVRHGDVIRVIDIVLSFAYVTFFSKIYIDGHILAPCIAILPLIVITEDKVLFCSTSIFARAAQECDEYNLLLILDQRLGHFGRACFSALC